MLSKSSLDFLERLMTSSGPSGFEFEPAAAFRNYAKGFAHEVRTDVTGNTIAVLNPDAKFKVMLAGHYDEIGFQVVYIDESGLVFFRPVGGIDKNTLPGIEVNILNARGEKIPGVIGRKPIRGSRFTSRRQRSAKRPPNSRISGSTSARKTRRRRKSSSASETPLRSGSTGSAAEQTGSCPRDWTTKSAHSS